MTDSKRPSSRKQSSKDKSQGRRASVGNKTARVKQAKSIPTCADQAEKREQYVEDKIDGLATLRKQAKKRLTEQSERLDSLSKKDMKHLINELGMHQIELEMQNEELRLAGKQIETSQAKYADLYDFSPVGYFTFDRNGLIRELNVTGANMLAMEKRSLLTKPFQTFTEPAYRTIFHDHLSKVFTTQTKQSCELTIRKRDGSVSHVQMHSLSLHTGEGSSSICRTAMIDVTERKRVEAEVRASESKFSAIFSLIHDPTIISDIETGRIIDLNDAAARAFGRPRYEVIGMTSTDLQAWADPDDRSRILQEMREKGEIVDRDFRFRKHTGEIRDTLFSAKFIEIAGKKYLLSRAHDITARRKKEENLKQSLSLLKATLESTADGILVADGKGKTINFNEQFAKFWNIPKTILELYDDQKALEFVLDQLKDPEQFIAKVRELYSHPEVSSFDVLNFKDGRVFERYSQPQRIDGKPVGRVWSFRDVTDHREAEQALRASEERYRSLFEDSPLSLWEEDVTALNDYLKSLRSSGTTDLRAYFADHPEEVLKCVRMIKVITVNRASLYLFEAPDQTTLLHDLSRVFTAESLAAFQEIMVALSEGAQLYECETSHQTLKGRTINVILRWSLLASDRMSRSRALISIVDISYRKRAEEMIRQNERFMRNTLDSVDEGFLVIDRDYRILIANKAYCSQVAQTCDAVIGKHCFEISHNISRPCYEEGEECVVQQVFATGEPREILHKHADPDGHILFMETKGFPIKDASGNVTAVIETLNDITEKLLLEEERLKTQKLESLGTLAGGIAHDFNNLLQGIFGYISMAKIMLSQPVKSQAMLEQAEKALHQSVNLTSQLLTFSKGGKPVKKLTDLRPVIDNSVKFTLSGSRCDFRLTIPEDLWQAEADEGQLGQVIQNIVLNADQAMPVGGTVMVTAANMAESDASLPAGLAKGQYVVIAIQDTGIGIPKQYLSKIFDPYFTTKEKGSGLGLATSYSIIRNHGGMIDVRTKSGEGSTFMIYLPAIEGKTRIEAAVGPAKQSLFRTASVLVMDDEEIIRNLTTEILGTLGHTVEVAKHGQEAIDKYESAMAAGKPFDIVILDLTVRGGMGGLETIQKLLEINPAVKAIVSSGYSDDVTTATYEKQGFKAFLNKPYDVDTLREVLNRMLTI
jgi:PAS domain S-box-containing protein